MNSSIKRKKLGFAMCGSFCTHRDALEVMKQLAAEYDITPILSHTTAETDTRFGRASELLIKTAGICGREPVTDIVEAERFAAHPLDLMLICPCTGNTAAKLANGITDTAVTMAAKAHLRCDRPLYLAIASNDAMSANLASIAVLLNRKNIYLVPMRQDSPSSKPHSLVADFSLCADSIKSEHQLRPIFREV